MVERLVRWLMAAAWLLLCTACGGGGGYSGKPAAPAPSSGASAPASFATAQDFLVARVQPRLDYCRTCHVAGGVADTEAGARMRLGADRADDEAHLKASWTAMGGNSPVSRILLMASGQAGAHSGGTPWPVDGDAYRDVSVMLACLDKPDECMPKIAALSTGAVAQAQPLLGGRRGSSAFELHCEGLDGTTPRGDDAELPVDPRTLVVNGANVGKAVYFNAFYENCLVNQPASMQPPKTCGEYRRGRDAGWELLNRGDAIKQGPVVTAAQFGSRWHDWGMSSRPDNFDELLRLQVGLSQAPFDNPYPLPGEDPNLTGGGSGQLPIGYVQTRDAEGRWTGSVSGGYSCASCHAGTIGERAQGLGGMWGLGASALDGAVQARLQRGQSDAVTGFEVGKFVMSDWDSLDTVPNPQKYAASHMPSRQDTPAWWNTGSRPRKFFDGGPSSNSLRILSSAFLLYSGTGAEKRAYSDQIAMNASLAIDSIRAPKYPLPVDTALAEQGAVLFHTKDLWAQPGNAQRIRPAGGNGSCAGCHGAYSPRFVNDKAYLSTPALEGIAAHISPVEAIGTDRLRVDQLSGIFADVWDKSWWSYPEGRPGYVPPESKTPQQEAADENLGAPGRVLGACRWRPGVVGYLAPPLYGVWASAPYLHNGSVPTIEQLLDPSSRPSIWRRQARTVDGVTGPDTRLDALDTARLGWKHDTLSCDPAATTKWLSCAPVRDQATIFESFSGNAPPVQNGSSAERMIYNTRIPGNGNQGHEFTDVLTRQERAALIEYLKTL
ncbi:hypothetical protein V4F39_14385 [Aquincola sp. MAHUQ-54]|uniref:Cytochrome c domain-containing protein n=1 Tax=Aquincola agrisoli TaxID=3119538 RepID=A0AAW9QD22_9BURK